MALVEKDEIEELVGRIQAIAGECAALPRLDERSDEDVIGYDEVGLPTSPGSGGGDTRHR